MLIFKHPMCQGKFPCWGWEIHGVMNRNGTGRGAMGKHFYKLLKFYMPQLINGLDLQSGDLSPNRRKRSWALLSTTTASFGLRLKISSSISVVWKFVIWIPIHCQRRNWGMETRRNGRCRFMRANGSEGWLPEGAEISLVRTQVQTFLR